MPALAITWDPSLSVNVAELDQQYSDFFNEHGLV